MKPRNRRNRTPSAAGAPARSRFAWVRLATPPRSADDLRVASFVASTGVLRMTALCRVFIATLKAEQQVAKQLDVSTAYVDEAVKDAASQVS